MNLISPLFPDCSEANLFGLSGLNDDCTFGQLGRQAAMAAGGLAAAGVGVGDPVVFQAGQRQEALVLFWAAMALGAVFVPLDATWPDYIVERALAQIRPRVVVCDGERGDLYRRLFPQALLLVLASDSSSGEADPATEAQSWPEWLARSPAMVNPAPNVPPTAPAAFLFTSGTTAAPKAVVLSRGALASGAQLTLKTFEWRPGERLINLPEPHTMSGLRNGLIAAPLGGMHWIPFGVAQRPNIFALLDGFETARAERLVVGPALVRQLVQLGSRVEAASLASVKAIYCTGAALSPAAADQFHARFNVPIINYYGLTETGGICVSQRLSDWRPNDRSLGLAAGAELRVRTESAELKTLGTGELQVRSRQLMSGYLADPEATAARFDQDWLRTGDLARMDADGRIYLVGRESGFIKTASTDRVAPEEIEQVLEEHPAVSEAAVLGLSTESGAERIAGLVVLSEASAGVSEMELAAFVGERLGVARTPSLIRFVTRIPRRDTGKIIRAELQELLREQL